MLPPDKFTNIAIDAKRLLLAVHTCCYQRTLVAKSRSLNIEKKILEAKCNRGKFKVKSFW